MIKMYAEIKMWTTVSAFLQIITYLLILHEHLQLKGNSATKQENTYLMSCLTF